MSQKYMLAVGLFALTLSAESWGVNLVTNGDFSSATTNITLVPAISPTSWTYAGGVAYVYSSGAAQNS